MTSRLAVGSVSTLAMGALLLGSASFWLNRPGTSPHAAPWGDIASLSPAGPNIGQADDKAQLLKLAALKSGTDETTSAASPAPTDAPAPAVPAGASASVAAPVSAPALANVATVSADATPAAAAPVGQPVEMASADDSAPAEAAATAPDTSGVKSNLINLNTASADTLDRVGAGHVGHAIVAHRPYHSIKDLVNKRVLRTSDYQKIESRVRVD